MATTTSLTPPPPPSSSLHTPQTPRFGFDDNYEPYSPPRKSTRISAQRSRATRTPPPQSSRSSNRTAHTSSPSSPPTAPKKQTPKSSSMKGGRKVSGSLDADSAASAAAALGLPTPEAQRKMDHKSVTAVRKPALLPTPNKTPKKRPSENAKDITAIARNIFPSRSNKVDEAMPSPKKVRRNYKGHTLDSSEAEEEDQSIQIFTDSQDRVPEVDMTDSNPFYGSSSVPPEPTKRASKRRRITVSGEGEQPAEKVERREDGLVYVFRGKRVFRKFGDEEAEDEDDAEDDDLAQMVEPNLRRPLTRSSITPRLLFPTPDQVRAKEKQSQATEDEEEAITDIEEPAPMDFDHHVATPKRAHFTPVAPATPPTTVRTTRSKKVDLNASAESDDEATVPSPTHAHIDSGTGARLSPYDNWSRTKTQATGRSSKKRDGASMSRTAKKTRG